MAKCFKSMAAPQHSINNQPLRREASLKETFIKAK